MLNADYKSKLNLGTFLKWGVTQKKLCMVIVAVKYSLAVIALPQ
jgi:uncharacterized membrane protein YwzB